MTLAVVLLAAGHGTRMNSKYQKVLHEVGGKPMVLHVFEASEAVADTRPVLVVGAGETSIQNLLGERAIYVVQEERLGTGHATMVATDVLRGQCEQVVVTYGDMPLLRPGTIQQLAQQQRQTRAAVVMLSVMGDTSSSFGRVMRNESGGVAEIVEVAEAKQRPNGADILANPELNVGVYCFAADWLWENLPNLPLRQARSGVEYYLTDMIGLAVEQDLRVEAVVLDDADEGLGAGTRAELVAVERAFRDRANRKWLTAGVTLIDPHTTFIDQDVSIGRDTVIWPNSFVQGKTKIGEDCVIGPNTMVRDAEVGDGCRLEQVVVEGVVIEQGTKLPPFTHLKQDKT